MDNEKVSLQLKTGANEYSTISYDPINKQLSFDRTQSGVDVAENFPSIENTVLKISQNKLSLDVFVDGCTIEVFANKYFSVKNSENGIVPTERDLLE